MEIGAGWRCVLAIGVAACLATTAVRAQEERKRAEPAGGNGLFVIQAADTFIAMAPQTGATFALPPESAAFWRQRWEEDRDTIARLKLDAVRDGTMLSLRLADNRVIRFVDELGTCAGFFTCISHAVHDYLEDHGWYVLSVGHGEGGWAYIVSRRTGEVIDLAATPVLSRDRKMALAWYPSVAEGPKLDVLHFNGEQVKVEEAVVEGACWTRAAHWSDALIPRQTDAETIEWLRVGSNGEDEPSGVKLKRVSGSWHLRCGG